MFFECILYFCLFLFLYTDCANTIEISGDNRVVYGPGYLGDFASGQDFGGRSQTWRCLLSLNASCLSNFFYVLYLFFRLCQHNSNHR